MVRAQEEFREDMHVWALVDREIAARALALVEATLREPFHGEGAPTPLTHMGADVWSRRLAGAHRVVYLVRGDRIDFLQARYHVGPGHADSGGEVGRSSR